MAPVVTPLKANIVAGTSVTLWVLFGGMGLLSVVAAANVANLFLVRLEGQRREVAVRTALGARRAEIARLYLLETVSLCTTGAMLAIALAFWCVSVVKVMPFDIPRLAEVRIDGQVLAFIGESALLLSILLTSIASFRRSSVDSARAVAGSRAAGATRDGHRARALLVTTQVALTLVLLVGGALTARTYIQLVGVDLGFDPENVIVTEIGIPPDRWQDFERIYRQLVERVSGLPGVAAAAAVTSVPLSSSGGFDLEVRRADPTLGPTAPDPQVLRTFFTPGYFQAIGTEVVEGVGVNSHDPLGVHTPVVLSAALARRLFADESVIGKQIHLLEFDGSVSSRRDPVSVVGVVEDVRAESPRDRPAEVVYVPIVEPRIETGFAPMSATLVIRTVTPTLGIVPLIRQAIHESDTRITEVEAKR